MKPANDINKYIFFSLNKLKTAIRDIKNRTLVNEKIYYKIFKHF